MDATIQIGADVRQALRGIDQLNRRLERIDRANIRGAKSMRNLEGAASGVSTALKAATVAFAGFAASRGLQGILDATQRMEGFRTQLTTYLGSQQLANAELQRLSQLARSLPQDVDELTQAFVIFNRFGIDTSNESMRAFSNIAAANSKSIIQFGEAVADAMTGEFERLKEFGIKVSSENGRFTARIGEDQVAVANSTSDLVEQLKTLGEEGGRFGNVTVGALTLAMSNFRGAIFETSAALGSGGLGLAIADTLNGFTALLTENNKAVEAFGDKLTKAFLYAKEAAILVFNNIELLAKAIGILIAIKVTTWVAGAAAAMATWGVTIAKALIPALAFLAKALVRTAVLALRHPLIGGIALIIGGIEYFTGALSSLAETFGLIGDESIMDDLVTQATELGNTITGPIIEGMDQFNSIGERVDEQFASIKERANQTTEALDEATAAQETQRLAAEAAARAEREKAQALTQSLADRIEELRVAGLSAEQQERIKVEKELTNQFGEQAVANAQEELDLYIQQRRQLQLINNLNREIDDRTTSILHTLGLTDDAHQSNMAIVAAEADALSEVDRLVQEGVISRQAAEDYKTLIVEDAANQRYELEAEQQRKIDQITTDSIQRRLMMNRSALAQQLSDIDRATLQRIGQEERQREIVNERIEFEKKSEAEKAQFALQQGAEVFNQLGTYNKRAFEAAKAFNIANAIMNTYMGATKALATYPPPFNFIAAAAVVAAGLAQVASIRSQSYSGRQLGGPVMNDTSYIVGENGPELFTPTTNGRITRNSDLGGGEPVTINFNITANDASGFDDLLIQRQGLITQLISDAMTERGQRSML